MPNIDVDADYWDSYWIVQGLIQSELYDIVKDTLENFMDELENFGFIPNGGRIYCECSMVVAFFAHRSHVGRPQPLTTAALHPCKKDLRVLQNLAQPHVTDALGLCGREQ